MKHSHQPRTKRDTFSRAIFAGLAVMLPVGALAQITEGQGYGSALFQSESGYTGLQATVITAYTFDQITGNDLFFADQSVFGVQTPDGQSSYEQSSIFGGNQAVVRVEGEAELLAGDRNSSGNALDGGEVQIKLTNTTNTTLTPTFLYSLECGSHVDNGIANYLVSDISSAYVSDSLGQIDFTEGSQAILAGIEGHDSDGIHGKAAIISITLAPGQSDLVTVYASDPITTAPPGAAPEPLTMSLGIAGIGLALRRRAKARPAA